MTKMVSFRLNRECREIVLNPDKVLYVCHYEHGASCIHFGKECFVRVQGEVAEVVSRLEAAMNDHDCDAVTAPSQAPGELKRAGVN